MLIICLALVADAIIGNYQEKIMKTHHVPNVEIVGETILPNAPIASHHICLGILQFRLRFFPRSHRPAASEQFLLQHGLLE